MMRTFRLSVEVTEDSKCEYSGWEGYTVEGMARDWALENEFSYKVIEGSGKAEEITPDLGKLIADIVDTDLTDKQVDAIIEAVQGVEK